MASWGWEHSDVLLIEADGKALFAAHGIPVPHGVVATTSDVAPLGDGPWMVKAQVPVGGRGKAGGIIGCATAAEVSGALTTLLGRRLKTHAVEACLIEQAVKGEERYLSVMVDAASYGFRVIYSAQGGVEIEQSHAAVGQLCAPTAAAVAETVTALTAQEPAAWRAQLAAIGAALGEMVVARELALAEINPLFVSADGCVAGDAKVVIDLNAVDRQPELASMITTRRGVYVDANRKIDEGFDYVELDPEGEIGLVTTGAGLSMMLIDELTARGAKPLNFCDIRTGQMRGSPARLLRVLGWITSHASLKAILVNIFAGITDLSEFATLLATAMQQTPDLHVPVVARLVGRNAADAKRILGAAQPGMLVTEDLNEAMERVEAIAGAGRRGNAE
jgi:succinyl-CoA synthetase beta subunit